jgi:ATP-dependent RNA helicase RhlE
MAPTRELAIQIDETFRKLAPDTGIRSVVVVGGLSEGPQLKAVKAGAQVVIATPGRLSDFVQRRLISLSKVEICVLDEADRMLDMGFLPSIRALLGAMPASRQTLFFSATIEKSVAHLVEAHLKNPVRIAIGKITKPAENVDLHVFEVEQERKFTLLKKLLREQEGTFLVFSRTKHGTDKLTKHLVREGVKAAPIHGNRSQNQRNAALKGFQNGSYRVLVATDVAARGIHVDGIAHVVNYDLPQVPEDFIHRVGRTGRAGLRGSAWTMHGRTERGEVRRIERALGVTMKALDFPIDPSEERITSKVVAIPVAAERRVFPRRRRFASR